MSACKVGALMDTTSSPLDGPDYATLRVSLGERYGPVPAAALSTALRRIGHDVGPTTIKDHRASRCACTRKATP